MRKNQMLISWACQKYLYAGSLDVPTHPLYFRTKRFLIPKPKLHQSRGILQATDEMKSICEPLLFNWARTYRLSMRIDIFLDIDLSITLFLAYFKSLACVRPFFLAYLSFCKADKHPSGNHTPSLQSSSLSRLYELLVTQRRGILFFGKIESFFPLFVGK